MSISLETTFHTTRQTIELRRIMCIKCITLYSTVLLYRPLEKKQVVFGKKYNFH